MPRGKDPNSQKNLIQNRPKNEQPTPEQRRKNAQKANAASHAAQRAKKTLREELEIALATDIVEKSTGKTVSRQYAMTAALVNRAIKGDARAYELIRDTIGQKPADKILTASIDPNVLREVEDMVHGAQRSG